MTEEFEKRRVRVIAESKDAGAVCEIRPDGTLKCIAVGREPRVITETLSAVPSIKPHLSIRITEGGSDPTLIARRLDVYSMKPFSRPTVALGSGGHRGWMTKAHNGIAHADEGRVFQQ